MTLQKPTALQIWCSTRGPSSGPDCSSRIRTQSSGAIQHSLQLFHEHAVTSRPALSGTSGIIAFVGRAVTFNGSLRLTSGNKTFLARDGRVSWRKILDFSVFVHFGDHGNILVANPSLGYGDPGNSALHYSTDQGNYWSPPQLGDSSDAYDTALVTSGDSGPAFEIRSKCLLGGSEHYVVVFSEVLNKVKKPGNSSAPTSKKRVVGSKCLRRLGAEWECLLYATGLWGLPSS
ncbi:KLTH0G12078p [Lachancea thermotolerans CBS 6340]|uniref:KLTH0G12078p n=1 Tax=Lachancea thermotolerans (strain ATCC 56472 / CBS 6340 / NRRL Y-8284) TaxID=559295 RepID=C5DMV9_LACTC|nr:KLTH0G12078p [Lachancea thermotolerans CBS 6340]CAR25120.1 KLTH0G12078p [Lachancea thermotolerans CBS 6340]